MFAPRRIVVPVDLFSEDSGVFAKEALDAATSLAKQYAATLHILTIEPPVYPVPGPDFSGETFRVLEEVRKAQNQRADEGLQKLVEQARAAGVAAECDALVSERSVAERLVEAAHEVGGDLIVVPSHGRKGIKRLFLGSVAERVAHLAKMPVLLLHANASDDD